MSKKTPVITDRAECSSAEVRNTHSHFEVVHFRTIAKPGYPSQVKGLEVFNASLPFIHATDDCIRGGGAPLQQFKGSVAGGDERRRLL